MAMIMNTFVSKLCGKLLTSVIEEPAKILGVPNEIKKLHIRLERIQGLIADTENRSFENRTINHWPNQLRDLMYDADDIINEFRIKGEKLLDSNSSTSRYFDKRIRDLSLELDELAKDETFLHLAHTPRDDQYSRSRISHRTSPVLVEPDLVGEKVVDDTRTLVDLINNDNIKKIPIFAIVGMGGMGGIGKTTLTQKIYNDEKLRNNFHQMPRIWLCVSQGFSESDLLRSIIKQAGGVPGEVKELITCRQEAFARQMGAEDIHRVEKLSKLSQEDGWSLICKMVFDKKDEQDQHDLSDEGKKIVEKCDGLPLALKTVGGVLRTKAKRPLEWEKVRSTPAWSFTKLLDGVMGALYLSYQDLPPPLKQCFTPPLSRRAMWQIHV